MDQGPQHKSSCVEPDRRENGKQLECSGIGDHFLNITLVAQTIIKWDFLRLKTCKIKDMAYKTK